MDPYSWNNPVAIATLILAFVTVSLAIAAFFTIRNSNEREKRRREEELAKEKRERKERLLNEIIEWAIDITRANFGGEILVTPGVSEKIQKRRDMLNRLFKCQELEIKGAELIKPSALSLDKEIDGELSGVVDQVIESLKVINGITRKGLPYNESEEASQILRENDSYLEQNIRHLLDKVARYRANI